MSIENSMPSAKVIATTGKKRPVGLKTSEAKGG
jgi:hypothetical protein